MRDSECIADQRPGSRSASNARDMFAFAEAHDIRHRQEVCRESGLLDSAQLKIELT